MTNKTHMLFALLLFMCAPIFCAQNKISDSDIDLILAAIKSLPPVPKSSTGDINSSLIILTATAVSQLHSPHSSAETKVRAQQKLRDIDRQIDRTDRFVMVIYKELLENYTEASTSTKIINLSEAKLKALEDEFDAKLKTACESKDNAKPQKPEST